MKYIIKLSLAALLLGCLFDVPYGYFQIVRLVGCALFCWLAYLEYQEKKIITTALCIGCALLLNPIVKVYFKRDVWNNIDLVIAIALVVWMIINVFVYLKNGKSSKEKTEAN